MSMDLEVWSATQLSLPNSLPESESWTRIGEEWCLEGSGWHLLVMTAEDEPAEQVKARLAGAKYVAFVTLEPIGSDKDAYSLLERTVRDLANGCSGVWVDPNGDVYGSEEGSFG